MPFDVDRPDIPEEIGLDGEVNERRPDEVSVGPNVQGTAGVVNIRGRVYDFNLWEQDERVFVFYDKNVESEFNSHQAKVNALDAVRKMLLAKTDKQIIFRAQ